MSIRLNAFNGYANTGKIANVNKSKKTGSSKGVVRSTGAQDSISISAGANDFSEIARAQTMISSDVNSLSAADRISEIKEDIASGAYQIDSSAIAGKILDRFA